MAGDNKTLARFSLDSIPPAPRGTPQIEVTFDIDANGIVNVSAKDKGTGKEQNITITASTNMSDEEIEQAVKDAEAHAAEDKKRREEIETRNTGDQMVYEMEKALGELGDAVSAEEKSGIEASIEELKEALKGDDMDAIKAKTEALQTKFHEVSQKLYEQQAAQQAAQQGAQGDAAGDAGGSADDDVVDAEFTEVDDE